jgi:biotin-dependent carboxylase-like uncharacterized protein
MDYGFQVSGAMDEKSLAIANSLVGNSQDMAGIEITIGGLSATFTSDAVIAITGADIKPELNKMPIPMYRAIYVKKDDVLECKFAKVGCRSYLAFNQGLALKKIMGSLSTNIKCKIGGYLGRPLKANDLLFFNSTTPNIKNIDKHSINLSISFKNPVNIRVILGPQDDYFTESGINTFFTSTYQLTKDSDRMGIKLDGPVVESKNGVDIISDGMPLGGVQIPSSGMPIIMMSDRQTTGGYAKIATVISTDVQKLAQLRPNDSIRFENICLEKAHKIYLNEKKYLMKVSKLWKQ